MQDTERKDSVGEKALRSETYQHIEFRDEKWRFKGLRANIIDAVIGFKARNESSSELALQLGLSVDAIEEAVSFVEDNNDLVTEHQRRMLKFANENSRR